MIVEKKLTGLIYVDVRRRAETPCRQFRGKGANAVPLSARNPDGRTTPTKIPLKHPDTLILIFRFAGSDCGGVSRLCSRSSNSEVSDREESRKLRGLEYLPDSFMLSLCTFSIRYIRTFINEINI